MSPTLPAALDATARHFRDSSSSSRQRRAVARARALSPEVEVDSGHYLERFDEIGHLLQSVLEPCTGLGGLAFFEQRVFASSYSLYPGCSRISCCCAAARSVGVESSKVKSLSVVPTATLISSLYSRNPSEGSR